MSETVASAINIRSKNITKLITFSYKSIKIESSKNLGGQYFGLI
jgi:hypothetical protein